MQHISLSNDQLLLSQARENLSQLVDEIDKGMRPGVSIIKNGQSKAVLISTDTYEQLIKDRQDVLEAIETSLGLLEGLKDYQQDKTLNEDEFFTKLAKKYGKNQKAQA